MDPSPTTVADRPPSASGRSLRAFFAPRSVALIGATDKAGSVGRTILTNLIGSPFGGTVYPVNPKGGEIEGLAVYRSLSEVPPGRLDRISVYLPPAVLMGMLEELANRGCDELFLNPGTESDEVVQKAYSLGLEPIQACSIVDLGVRPDQI